MTAHLLHELKVIFGWSENRKDEKQRKENRRNFEWKWCLVGVILEKRKWWGPPIFSHGPPFFNSPKLERKWKGEVI